MRSYGIRWFLWPNGFIVFSLVLRRGFSNARFLDDATVVRNCQFKTQSNCSAVSPSFMKQWCKFSIANRNVFMLLFRKVQIKQCKPKFANLQFHRHKNLFIQVSKAIVLYSSNIPFLSCSSQNLRKTNLLMTKVNHNHSQNIWD